MNKTEYDVIVIGGSFAGLSCSSATARNGLKTMVLEKKPWPGTRVHTTGIIVRELADIWNVPSRLTRKIEKVRLYSPNLNYLDLYSPDYYFLATDTPELIRWHTEQAIQSGASIRYNTDYRSSEKKGGFHYLDGENLKCRYMIGCDGSLSKVARQYSLGKNRHFLLGTEAEFGQIDGVSESHLHVFLNNDIARGYIGWIVPGVNSFQVGLATRSPLKPSLDKFIKQLSRLFSINIKHRTGARSGLIPCGGIVSPFYTDDVLLLGDAAGMVSPVTAGGIHPAVNIGNTAGELVSEYLLYHGDNPGPVLDNEIPKFRFKHGLRFLFDHVPVNNQMYDKLLNTRFFRLTAQTLFFHNRGFFSASAWKDILKMNFELK